LKICIKPGGGVIQVEPQNYEKVKKIVGSIVRKGSERLSIPEQLVESDQLAVLEMEFAS
jgi:hypothetical protein